MMCFLFIFLNLLGSSWGSTYTLADLEVLARENSHEEFFSHAMDIRPSERQENWQAMVSKMADSWGRKILGQAKLKKGDFLHIENLYQWPVLNRDDVFKARRQAVGLRYLGQCLKAQAPCWEEVRTFWEKDKNDPEIAFKLAEYSSQIKNSPFTPWSFLEVALKSSLSEFYCKKKFVMDTLWGKIEIDYVRLGPEGDLLSQIDRTVHPDCLPALISEARKRLYRPEGLQDRELSFQILKAQSKADQELTDFFYTVYLLDNPSKGELFNYSWNRIKDLGNAFARREAVLEKLKSLDPLPDSILKSLDETKKKVVLKHFKVYFPEYLDHYTNQCIEYYSGRKSFPRGNPAVSCQDLMNSQMATEIIDEFKIKQFQEARKI